jgi:hypothetical protein
VQLALSRQSCHVNPHLYLVDFRYGFAISAPLVVPFCSYTLMLTLNMICSRYVLTALHCVFYSHLVTNHVSGSSCFTAHYLCGRMITQAFLVFLTTEKKFLLSMRDTCAINFQLKALAVY